MNIENQVNDRLLKLPSNPQSGPINILLESVSLRSRRTILARSLSRTLRNIENRKKNYTTQVH